MISAEESQGNYRHGEYGWGNGSGSEEKLGELGREKAARQNKCLQWPDKPDGAHFCSLHMQPVCECCSLLPASHQPVNHTLVLILEVKGQMMVIQHKGNKKLSTT